MDYGVEENHLDPDRYNLVIDLENNPKTVEQVFLDIEEYWGIPQSSWEFKRGVSSGNFYDCYYDGYNISGLTLRVSFDREDGEYNDLIDFARISADGLENIFTEQPTFITNITEDEAKDIAIQYFIDRNNIESNNDNARAVIIGKEIKNGNTNYILKVGFNNTSYIDGSIEFKQNKIVVLQQNISNREDDIYFDLNSVDYNGQEAGNGTPPQSMLDSIANSEFNNLQDANEILELENEIIELNSAYVDEAVAEAYEEVYVDTENGTPLLRDVLIQTLFETSTFNNTTTTTNSSGSKSKEEIKIQNKNKERNLVIGVLVVGLIYLVKK